MSDYRLNDPDKGVIGPIRLQTVVDLASAGVIHEGFLASRDGGPFRPVGEFPEIGLSTPGATTASPDFAGDLGKHSFLKVFFRFYATGATGHLVLSSSEATKEIFMEQGEPTFVHSNQPEEKLGQYLLRTRRLDEKDLEVALQSMHTDQNRLGGTLVRLGLLDVTELREALRSQQLDRLAQLCAWRAGRYAFYTGVRYRGDYVPLSLPVSELLARAARLQPEELLREKLAPQRGATIVPLKNRRLSVDNIPFTTEEQKVLPEIRQQRTVAEILAIRSGADYRAALTVLYLLDEVDAIAFRQ